MFVFVHAAIAALIFTALGYVWGAVMRASFLREQRKQAYMEGGKSALLWINERYEIFEKEDTNDDQDSE